jgi:hypothetical protein
MIDLLVYRAPLQRETSRSLPRNEFHRLEFRHSAYQIEQWRLDTLQEIRHWLQMCAAPWPPPKRRTACAWPSRCPYYGVCEIDSIEGQLDWLHGSQYEDNTWNPMKD